jgi:hypothetical protein
MQTVSASLGAADFASAWDAGHALSLAEAAALPEALGLLAPSE